MIIESISYSRGSKYLDYETWKVFLEELAYRKRLTFEIIQEKLLAAGKPAQNPISVKPQMKQTNSNNQKIQYNYYHEPKTPSEAIAIADQHHHPA